MRKKQEKDDGSVWTSYSDMFTTMAIIFLVMFVFALLRSGVATLEAVKEKKESKEQLEGKVPKFMGSAPECLNLHLPASHNSNHLLRGFHA